MQLKSLDAVEWRDLPKVESPSFARAWVETNLYFTGHAPPLIDGLTGLIAEELDAYSNRWGEHLRNRLLDRVERAEVLFIHGFESSPMDPVLRRVEGDQGLGWKVQGYLSADARHNIEQMLARAW